MTPTPRAGSRRLAGTSARTNHTSFVDCRPFSLFLAAVLATGAQQTWGWQPAKAALPPPDAAEAGEAACTTSGPSTKAVGQPPYGAPVRTLNPTLDCPPIFFFHHSWRRPELQCALSEPGGPQSSRLVAFARETAGAPGAPAAARAAGARHGTCVHSCQRRSVPISSPPARSL
jgi:hypothetical protein